MNFEAAQELDEIIIPYENNCYEITTIDDEVIKRICQLCGVCWETRNIQIPASKMIGKLDSNQIVSLGVFQNNVIHFFEHFDNFMKINSTYSVDNCPLFSGIAKNFEKRATKVFLEMARNFVDQVLQTEAILGKQHKTSGNECNFGGSISDKLINKLCSGDLEKTLKLVPSRELARQMGISDLRLRREIYVARQRALKKRPIAKIKTINRANKSEYKTTDFFSDDFDNYFDIAVTTCASPPSSTQTSISVADEFSTFDDDGDDGENFIKEYDQEMEMEVDSEIQNDADVKEVKVVAEIDGWMNVESWLKSDIFEA